MQETVIRLSCEWEPLWRFLCREFNGPRHGKETFMAFKQRYLVVSPYAGSYGHCGWILCVNGSPPHGTIVIPHYNPNTCGGHDFFFLEYRKSRKIRYDSKLRQNIIKLLEKHCIDRLYKDEWKVFNFYLQEASIPEGEEE